MAPTLNRILDTAQPRKPEVDDDSNAQFRKLPFGGKQVSRAIDEIAPSNFGNPHITSHLNETYFTNFLHKEKISSGTGFIKDFRDSTLEEEDILDELLNSSPLPRRRSLSRARIANHPHESYFKDALPNTNSHKCFAYVKREINSTYNFPEPQPLDQQVQNQSTTLGLILVGVFILVAILLFFKFVKRNTWLSWKGRSASDRAENGASDTFSITKEERVVQMAEFRSETEWVNIPL